MVTVEQVMVVHNLQEDLELVVIMDLIYKAAERLITAVVEGEGRVLALLRLVVLLAARHPPPRPPPPCREVGKVLVLLQHLLPRARRDLCPE